MCTFGSVRIQFRSTYRGTLGGNGFGILYIGPYYNTQESISLTETSADCKDDNFRLERLVIRNRLECNEKRVVHQFLKKDYSR